MLDLQALSKMETITAEYVARLAVFLGISKSAILLNMQSSFLFSG